LGNLIEAPMCVLKMGRSEVTQRARELLAKVRLSDKQNCYPATLSGGEQQRVAIARAMMMNPQILLLDEITSALDPELVWEVLEVVKEVVNAGTTVIMATHHINFAREISNQVIFLDNGKVVESGTEVLKNPQYPRTQEFLRRVLAGTS
jgi:ABC-type polar amino acid transport system ATPase subunit